PIKGAPGLLAQPAGEKVRDDGARGPELFGELRLVGLAPRVALARFLDLTVGEVHGGAHHTSSGANMRSCRRRATGDGRARGPAANDRASHRSLASRGLT